MGKRTSVYFDDKTYSRLEKSADSHERSISKMAVILIREALDAREQKGGKS